MLHGPKLKELADDKVKLGSNDEIRLRRDRNIVGNGEPERKDSRESFKTL